MSNLLCGGCYANSLNTADTGITVLPISENVKKSACYHSECRKSLVNIVTIERLRAKKSRCDSPASSLHGPGRPTYSSDTPQPKRTKTIPKSQICMFLSCDFCPNDNVKPLHRVASDSVGKTLTDIKRKTVNDQVRTCVSELVDIGDASALEKWYHRACLCSAQHIIYKAEYSDIQLFRSICDEELIISIQNTLTTVMILSFRTDMPGQTEQTQIRLLLEGQSDQGLHCLPFRLHRLDSLLYGRAP